MQITQSPAGDPRGKRKSRSGQPERNGRRTQIGETARLGEADPLVGAVVRWASAHPITTQTSSVPLQVPTCNAALRSSGARDHLERSGSSERRSARAARSMCSSEHGERGEPNRRSDTTPVLGPGWSNQTGFRAGAVEAHRQPSGRHRAPEMETARRALARRAVENYRNSQYT